MKNFIYELIEGHTLFGMPKCADVQPPINEKAFSSGLLHKG